MQAGGRGRATLLVDALPVSPDLADLRQAFGSAARLLLREVPACRNVRVVSGTDGHRTDTKFRNPSGA